ncbi:hypothetical protein BDZ85DRAFT_248867 [Elsinoe ampelina]|uniref:Uncharacterized protein n=1 Tax=Elsinoe ampelina TaxID=302913 RepID=A0A6A6GED9_9PEZI|nr:hypothetical protein BDZ85DRAFT_248867 [Elsinoe ampelina]
MPPSCKQVLPSWTSGSYRADNSVWQSSEISHGQEQESYQVQDSESRRHQRLTIRHPRNFVTVHKQARKDTRSPACATWHPLQAHGSICDLRNISNDRQAEKRTMSTTDPLYISQPYFSTSEADLLKHALMDEKSPADSPASSSDGETVLGSRQTCDATGMPLTVEQVIQSRLASFFEKRRASGDARPCGPHDMLPVYQDVFGISKTELEDPAFLSRLARSGLAT